MRGSRLLAGVAMALAPLLAPAQQQPQRGCNAALSCRPLGFSTLNPNQGGSGSTLFGVGFRWDPGFKLYIAGPNNISFSPTPAPPVDGQIFHLGTSLMPPTPAPTPTVAPAYSEPAPRGRTGE